MNKKFSLTGTLPGTYTRRSKDSLTLMAGWISGTNQLQIFKHLAIKPVVDADYGKRVVSPRTGAPTDYLVNFPEFSNRNWTKRGKGKCMKMVSNPSNQMLPYCQEVHRFSIQKDRWNCTPDAYFQRFSFHSSIPFSG